MEVIMLLGDLFHIPFHIRYRTCRHFHVSTRRHLKVARGDRQVFTPETLHLPGLILTILRKDNNQRREYYYIHLTKDLH